MHRTNSWGDEMKVKNALPYAMTIKWGDEHRCRSFLRNGYAHQDGIMVQEYVRYYDRELVPHFKIYAVNSTGLATSGYISIPQVCLDDVIDALQKLKDANKWMVIDD